MIIPAPSPKPANWSEMTFDEQVEWYNQRIYKPTEDDCIWIHAERFLAHTVNFTNHQTGVLIDTIAKLAARGQHQELTERYESFVSVTDPGVE